MAKLNSFAPDATTTLPSFITSGKKLSISHESITMKYQLNDDTIISFQGLMQKYHHALTNYIEEIELSDEEYDRYRFRPKLLSQDLYGTPELWSELLYINHMMSTTDFNKRAIKVYNSGIIDIVTEIQMLCKKDIKKNRASLTE